MLFQRKDLHLQLLRHRNQGSGEEILLQEVQEILRKEDVMEKDILQRLENKEGSVRGTNDLDFNILERDHIFHISHIKKICVRFRLRFLGASRYQGVLPQEVIWAIKDLEKRHDTRLQDFYMVAPAGYFKLEKADDPMLFVPLGNQYYYLILKWGRDMHPVREILLWPLRNFETLILSCLLAGFLLTFAIQELFFARYRATSEFLILFMYTFKSTLALIIWYGISLGKNFSSGNWNSHFHGK